MFTSEMHDPYTRITVAWKIEQHKSTKTPSKGTGVGPTKHRPKVKSENAFYNSRVLERD